MKDIIGQELVFEDEQGEEIVFPIVHAFTALSSTFVFVTGVDEDDEEVVIPFRVIIQEDGMIETHDIGDNEWDVVEAEWLRLENESIDSTEE